MANGGFTEDFYKGVVEGSGTMGDIIDDDGFCSLGNHAGTSVGVTFGAFQYSMCVPLRVSRYGRRQYALAVESDVLPDSQTFFHEREYQTFQQQISM